MTVPRRYSFTRYLAAKRPIDDRSLNRPVWAALVDSLRDRGEREPAHILELGAGIGTMVGTRLGMGIGAKGRIHGRRFECDVSACRPEAPLRLGQAQRDRQARRHGRSPAIPHIDGRLVTRSTSRRRIRLCPPRPPPLGSDHRPAFVDLIDLSQWPAPPFSALPPGRAVLLQPGLRRGDNPRAVGQSPARRAHRAAVSPDHGPPHGRRPTVRRQPDGPAPSRRHRGCRRRGRPDGRHQTGSSALTDARIRETRPISFTSSFTPSPRLCDRPPRYPRLNSADGRRRATGRSSTAS